MEAKPIYFRGGAERNGDDLHQRYNNRAAKQRYDAVHNGAVHPVAKAFLNLQSVSPSFQ
jgi:hypothetical protein